MPCNPTPMRCIAKTNRRFISNDLFILEQEFQLSHNHNHSITSRDSEKMHVCAGMAA